MLFNAGNSTKNGESVFLRSASIITIFILITFIIVSANMARFEIFSRVDFWDVNISLFNIIVSIFFISISLTSNPVQLNMAFLWVFQYAFFGVTGLLNQLDPSPYYLTELSSDMELFSASKLIWISQFFLGFGQLLQMKTKRKLNAEYTKQIYSQKDFAFKRINTLFFCYVAIVPFVISQLGGLSFLFKTVRFVSFNQDLAISVNAILLTVLYVPPVIVLMTYLYIGKLSPGNSFKKFTLIFWILLLSNPLSNARQNTLFLLLPIVFYFLQFRKKMAIGFFTFLPFIFFFSASIFNRFNGQFQSPRLTMISRDGDFDAFSQIANGLRIVSQGEFKLFRQVLASLLFFVPRTFFPGKPNDTGVELARLLGLKFQNLSAPWILEAYVNARLIGVIFLSFVIGFYLTKLDLRSALDMKYFLIGSLTTGFLFILLRGSLLQATGRAIFSILLVLFLFRDLKPESIKSAEST